MSTGNPGRDPALQALVDAVVEGIAARAHEWPGAEGALDRVRAALASVGTLAAQSSPEQSSPDARPLPEKPLALAHLDEALERARSAGGPAATAAAAFKALKPRVGWYARQSAQPTCANFAERHALASLIGPADRPGCLEIRDDLRIGISLVAPETPYPDHKHPPEELYLALTDGDWRHERGAWFTPGPGGVVYHAGNVLHGMRARGTPQLAVWCLPVS